MLDSHISPRSSSGISWLKGHKKIIAWKVYFYAFLCMTLLSYAGLMGEKARLIDILDTLASSALLVAIFSYTYKKRLFSSYGWIFIGLFCLSENILYTYLTHITLHENSPSTTYTFGTILIWLINLPAFITLFLNAKQK
ncbi:hypothetical protein [uncultured Shewanella sp.]|uniref:hypothetical protein n=1 Tax=uncultured Shewanella sp. TaxID=173975 RepID=UPI0026317B49|nr:hypothetical protein [uncultured Shewanella sp.]